MASAHLSNPTLSPISNLSFASPWKNISMPTGVSLSFAKKSSKRRPLIAVGRKTLKWVVRLSLVEQEEEQSLAKPRVDMDKMVDFLCKDLPHLFDDQGIDKTAYDEKVKFRDPITKHDSVSGYLFNIALLKQLFKPDFQLHWVKQTGSYEITTRWTMIMRFMLLPWKPELVFTGTSVMGINPETGNFCSHIDYWDSLKNNDYFSLEGFLDMLKQLRIYKTPDLETPTYQILKRTSDYEVRKYSPFIVVETDGDKLSGSTGFNSVAGYIFGKNSATKKLKMTTPVFTEAVDPKTSDVSIQIVLPREKDFGSLPIPNQEGVKLRQVEGGIAAALKFSGKPTEDVVCEKERALRSSLIRDGIKPRHGCLFARYNDPGRTWNFIMERGINMASRVQNGLRIMICIPTLDHLLNSVVELRTNQTPARVMGSLFRHSFNGYMVEGIVQGHA